jgi:energy-converting hydrogenase Eha subunit A
MKRTQLKLLIENQNLREKFVSHVEGVDSEHQIVIVCSGDAVILEYPLLAYTEVFYTSWSDAMLNRNPVITLGVDAVQQPLNNGDREAIGYKRTLNGIV